MNSLIILSRIYILDEVVSRPTVINFSLLKSTSIFLYSYTSFEIDSFFQYVAFLIIFYSNQCLSKNENVKENAINFFAAMLLSLTYPGFFLSASKNYTLFSRHSFMASAKGFFED